MSFNKEKSLKEAEKLVAKGKDREAIAEYQKVVKADPKDLGSLNKIGDLYLKLNDKNAAVECFAQIADKYASDGFNLRAIAMLKKCTRTDPTRWDFHERLADLNAQQGLTNEAKASYTLVAEHYLKENKLPKARELYARIAEIEPENLKNRLKLADLYLKDNQLDLALGEYQVIGSELAKKGMLDEALQVLEKALGLAPNNVQILRAMARTHADMGRAEEGLRFVRARLAEKGGNDPELLLVYGETCQASGNFDAARQAFERALQVAPDRADVRMALYRLALEQGDADAALAHHAAASDALIAVGKGQQAIDDLRAILRVREGHVATLERLLAVQVRLGADERSQGEGMSRLAEAYIAQGRYAEAEAVLNKLVVREPDVAQHAEKLEFVRMKLRSGGAGAPPPAAPSASVAAAEPASDSFSMSFEEGELEAGPRGDGDRTEFVGERIAEADVFIKYGLVDKAVEQLQAILAQYPDDLATRQKLKTLLVEEGRRGEAVEQCLAIARISRQAGDATTEREAVAQALQLDPTHAGVRAFAGAGAVPAAAAPAPPSASGGFDLSLDEPSFAPAQSRPSAPSPTLEQFDLTLSEKTPAPAAADEFEISLDDAAESGGGGEFEISLDDEPAAPAGNFGASHGGAQAGFAMGPPSADAEPEMEISLDDEASSGGEFEISIDDAPAESSSSDAFEMSLDSDSGADEASFELGGTPSSPTPELEVSLDEPAAPAAAAPASRPAAVAEAPAEEGLFGEEEDFFNFAEELNRELETSEVPVSREQDEAMSLEQIISGIQKGVAEQVDKEDYETHYNLGIAYKEMGLTDEAIGEFQYASKEPAKFYQCCILLGACFTEKGMPELAVNWYLKGKTAQGLTEEDLLALDYEIGLGREAMGDDAGALKTFLGIYGANARYRDVGQRMATLKSKLGK